MNIEIKSRFNENVIFSTEAKSLKFAVEIAVKEEAYLRGADLREAYLTWADLRGARLTGADLTWADLTWADLREAYLTGADLRGAYLRGADLREAYLTWADLRGAYLRGADLRGAYLRGADLREAYLTGADLRGARLRGVKEPPVNDHYFTSEILFRAATTENQKSFSARIRMELNLCWKDFYELAQKMKVVAWAEKTLSKWDEYKKEIATLKK